jgi:hypothetical protein
MAAFAMEPMVVGMGGFSRNESGEVPFGSMFGAMQDERIGQTFILEIMERPVYGDRVAAVRHKR